MHRPAQDVEGCTGQCEHCSLQQPQPGGLSGGRLVLTAIGVFLAPLGLTIAGAALAGPQQPRQTVYALAGLGLGIGIAIITSRMLRKKTKENS